MHKHVKEAAEGINEVLDNLTYGDRWRLAETMMMARYDKEKGRLEFAHGPVNIATDDGPGTDNLINIMMFYIYLTGTQKIVRCKYKGCKKHIFAKRVDVQFCNANCRQKDFQGRK